MIVNDENVETARGSTANDTLILNVTTWKMR